MGKPVQRLTGEFIGQHQALRDFRNYITRHQGTAPTPEKITVLPEGIQVFSDPSQKKTTNGKIILTYIDESCRVNQPCRLYSMALWGLQNTTRMRHGWGILVRDAKGPWVIPEGRSHQASLKWVDAVQEKTQVPGACSTFHALGGDRVQAVKCQDTLSPQAQYRKDLRNTLLGIPVAFLLTDLQLGFINRLLRKKTWWPLTRFLLKNLKPMGKQAVGLGSLLAQAGPGLLTGGLAMGLSYLLTDSLGLKPKAHRHEKMLGGALLAQGAQRGSLWLLARSTRVPLRPVSFTAGLITARLVDATIGPVFREGSWMREALYAGSFFLPQLFRSMMGARRLMLAKKLSKGRFLGRLLGRALLVTTVADGVYGISNLIREGIKGSIREKWVYRRAHELRTEKEGRSLWRGALRIVAPFWALRKTVSQNYVLQARQELTDFTEMIGQSTVAHLMFQLVHGNRNQNLRLDFYQRITLSELQKKNDLTSSYKWLHPEDDPYGCLFDSSGRLEPGQDLPLIRRVLHETGQLDTTTLSDDQIKNVLLGLRKRALMVRIRQLKNYGRTTSAKSSIQNQKHLKTNENLAIQLGLLDKNKQPVPSPVNVDAQRVPISLAPLLQTSTP